MNLCSICARGGSKGVKNKNLREIGGKPLIVHTIEHAIKSELFDEIAVSSDSDKILEIAEKYNVHSLKRPDELATDKAAKLPVIQHCGLEIERLTNKKFDYFVDLDATSPLRTVDDIKNSLKALKESDAGNLITGSPSRRSPYFNLVEELENGRVALSKALDSSVVRRQDAPKTFDMNASIYIWKRDFFFKSEKVINDQTILFSMPEERSHDIDSELDFKIVKFIMENGFNV